MSPTFSFPVKMIAFCTALIFSGNQIVWADGILPPENPAATLLPVQAVSESQQVSVAAASLPASTSTDFLGQTLSLEPSAAQEDPAKTVSYDPARTAANVTAISGSPYPYITGGSSTGTDLSYNASTTQSLLKYDVTNTGDTSGFTVSFDNESTATVETRNLSTLANLTFGLQGTPLSVTFEIVDSLGCKDSFILSGIAASTERFWSLPLASISTMVDKTRIKQLNFVVSQKDTTFTSSQGTLLIRIKGLKATVPSAPGIASAGSLVTNQTTFVLSGTKEANTAILVNGVEVVARNSDTIWSVSVPLTAEGNNAFRISTRNSIGLISSIRRVMVRKDTVAPSGSININSGAVCARSRVVTLNLSAADNTSGMSEMSFSTDSIDWTAPVAYEHSKVFTLPAGDGSKTVYVKYYDRAGNVSAVYSRSIVLEAQPSQGTVKMNGGVSFINQTVVELDLSVSDAGSGVRKMRFSKDGTTWTRAETYAASKTWTFPDGDGIKEIYVKFQDKTGKWSAPVLTTVFLDTSKPTGSIHINSGALYTRAPEVQLDLLADDSGSGVETMAFSTDSINWIAPEAYASSRSYHLSSGDGVKTVYVKFFDKAGNASGVCSKTISLDTVPPEVVIDAATPALINVKSLTVHYTLDGISKSKTFTELVEGENSLTITETDAAGNTTLASWAVRVASPPVIVFTSPQSATNPVYRLTYTVDGLPVEETRILSAEGENVLTVTKADGAGNVTRQDFTVTLALPFGGEEPEDESGFSLTTANGEVLHYLAGQLNGLESPDGSAVSGVELDSDGNLLNAFARIADGSLEVLENGTRLIYRRPDGSHAYYDQGELTKIITRDGLTVLYSYLRDALGNILEIVADSDLSRAIYDAAGKLKSSLDKKTGRRIEYEGGILAKVISADGNEALYTRTFSDGEVIVTPAQAELSLVEYTFLKYDAGSFLLKEACDKEGRTFLFEGGRLSRVLDASGNALDVGFAESALSNITDFEISGSGLSANYNAQGELNRVAINDLLIHYQAGSGTIDLIEKRDGTELRELVFDIQGTLTGAVIIDPQGTERTYQDGKLVRVISPEAVETFFDQGQIKKLITAEKLTYHFNYTPQGITASLDPANVPIPSTVIQMEYGQDLKLQKMIKRNQEIISFTDDRLFRVEAPDGSVKTYAYEKDAQGNVLSTTITQGNVETFLDDQNRPVRSLVHPAPDAPDSLEVLYRYGKIREVFKNGTIAFKYSYQFDTNGAEQTVIEDLEEKAVKIYDGEFLLTSFHKETSVLSSYSYAGGHVSGVTVSRLGKTLHTYSYGYEGENTVVTDETGVVRTYGKERKLCFLERDNEKFAYGYFLNDAGEEIIEEKLIQRTLSDGSRVHYEGREASWIDLPDGSRMTELVLDNERNVVRASITLPSGVKKIFNEGEVIEQIDPDGTHFYFEKNRLVKMTDPSGREFTCRYDNQPDGTLVTAWAKSGDHYFQFDPSGSLTGIRLLNIPDGIDGAVDFTDGSASDFPVSGFGNVRLETSDPKFGWGSGYFDGSSDFLRVGDSSAFDFSGGVWTMDFWMKKDSFDRSEVLYAQVQQGDEKIYISVSPDEHGKGVVVMQYETDMHDSQPVITIYTAGDLVPGRWQHVAIIQKDRNFYIFIDGVLRGASPEAYLEGSFPLHMNDYASEIQIGSGTTFNGRGQNGTCAPDFTGQIDDFRISNGVARWTSNFDVPLGSFTPDTHTKLFLDFETLDRSYYSFTRETDAEGQPGGYSFTGDRGRFDFDLTGNLASGSDPVVAAELTGGLASILTLPPKVSESRFSGSDERTPSWFSTATASILKPDTVIAQEYSSEGVLETQSRADQTTTLFENNKPSVVLDETGNVLIEYSYDVDGNPVRIFLKNARSVLPEEVERAKTRVEEERSKALLAIAEAKRLAFENIKFKADSARAQLSGQISQIQKQIRDLEGTKVYGSKNKKAKSRALDQGRNVLAQAQGQWAELHRQEADAYARLDQEAQAASDKTEADAIAAFVEIAKQEAKLKREILYQETAPVIYHYYRNTLGRDPGQAEYQYWVDRVNYDSGETNVEVLTTDGTPLTQALLVHLNELPELIDRQTYVASIKQRVVAGIGQYLSLSQADREAWAASLGLSTEELIALTEADASKILGWLNSRPLHFGQSAFLALESLFDQKGIAYEREDIAVRCILIDILTGVISPLDDGDLVLSIYALNKTASLYGLDLTGARLSYDDLFELYNDIRYTNDDIRLIAHINGNHFVVVTDVTETAVTYIDTGIGRDKQNESVTVTKEGFLGAWKGYVTGETPVIASVATQSQILTRDQAQSVRGAFFGSLLNLIGLVMNIIVPGSGIIFNIAALVMSIVEGDWMSAISSVVGIAFSGFELGNFFKGTFSGISDAFGKIGTFFGGIFNPVAGFLGKAIDFLPGFSTAFASRLATEIVNTSLYVGVSYGLSKGLTMVGVSPELAGFAGSLASGMILGGMSELTQGQIAKGLAQSDIVRQNVLGVVTLQNVGSLGQELDLDPTFTSVVGLSLGAIQGNIIQNPGTTLEQAFKNVLPSVTSSLAFYGVDRLGTSLGLPAGISGLLGVAFSSTVAQLTDGLINSNGGGGPGSIFSSMKNILSSRELWEGMTAIGVNLATEELDIDPLFSALGLRLATAGVMGAINPNQTMISSMAEAFLESLERLDPFSNSDVSSLTSLGFYFSQTVAFSNLIQERGLLGALEAYATAIFQRDALESIFHQGGLADILTGQAEYTVLNGIPVKAIHIDANNDLYFSSTDDSILLGRRIGNQVEKGTFVIGPDGQFLLKDGVVETTLADGLHTILEVKNGYANGFRVFSKDKALFEIYATGGNQIVLRPDGTIYSAIFINKVTGARLEFSEGRLVSFTMPATGGQNLNLSGMSLAKLTSIQKQALVSFVASNGIWNTQPEGVPPDKLINLMNRLVERGVDPSSIFLAPMFENGNPVTDTLSWVVDMLGGDQLTHELMNKLDQKWVALTEAQRTHGVTAVMYSGSTNPFLKAVEQRDYNVSTIIALGGPTLEGAICKGTINNPSVRRFINVYGENDFVPLAGGNKFFTGPNGAPIANINIKILGAGHFDYLPAADGSNKIGEFVARLSEAAQASDSKLDYFFETTAGVSYDENTHTYIVNPDGLTFEEGNS